MQMILALWLALLGATLGSDDFYTRNMWSKSFSSFKLTRFACLAGVNHPDVEVAYRCRQVFGMKRINLFDESDEILLLLVLGGTNEEVGKYLGNWGYMERCDRLEQVGWRTGLLDRWRRIFYGPTETTTAVLEMRIRIQERIERK